MIVFIVLLVALIVTITGAITYVTLDISRSAKEMAMMSKLDCDKDYQAALIEVEKEFPSKEKI